MAGDPCEVSDGSEDDVPGAPTRTIVALVNQALDDLEAEHLKTADVLRLVAEHAWSAGFHSGLAAATVANGRPPIPRGTASTYPLRRVGT